MAIDMRHFIPIQSTFLKADHQLAGYINVKEFIENMQGVNVQFSNQMLKFLIVAMYEKNDPNEKIDTNQEIDVNGLLSFNKL